MEHKAFEIPSPCGIACDSEKCLFFLGEKEPKCPGCIECAGKPFWGECKIYKCAAENGVEHCGLCKDFPCDLLPEQFDPSNPRGKEEAIFRIGQLTIRGKIGTKKWLKRLADGSLVLFDQKN
jgi:hypothetical protein